MPVSVSFSCHVKGEGGAPLGFRPPQVFEAGCLLCPGADGSLVYDWSPRVPRRVAAWVVGDRGGG